MGDVSETKRPRRTLPSIGAVLAGFLVIVLISTATDMVMHGSGVFPPLGAPMSDSLFPAGDGVPHRHQRRGLLHYGASCARSAHAARHRARSRGRCRERCWRRGDVESRARLRSTLVSARADRARDAVRLAGR